MYKSLPVPYTWDSIDKSILQKSANLIKNFSLKAIKEVVIEKCKKNLEFSSIWSHNVLVVKHALLGVDDAAIIARFKKYPKTENDDFLQITGMARLFQVENGILPVVLLFPDIDETFLDHECIHLCQWLNNQSYLLTMSERIALFQQKIEVVIKSVLRTNPEEALDLLFRLTCYKVWIELEAYYSGNTQYVIQHAHSSSRPFEMFSDVIPIFGIDRYIPDAKDRCMNEFIEFCNELESQVEWVRNSVIDYGVNSLHEALWRCNKYM